MENNGKGLFYGVIGVATLIVAIIGATFAYFSAQVSSEGAEIKGQTNDVEGALSLKIERVKWSDAEAGSDDLVPAAFDKIPDQMDTSTVNSALEAKCESGGFTGCHIWKITAKSTQTLQVAHIMLNLKVGGKDAEVESKWSFAVFEGTETPNDSSDGDNTIKVTSLTASEVKDKGSFNSIAGTGADIHQAGVLNAEEDTIYYLMIYLKNEDDDQSTEYAKEDQGKNSYSGTVTLDAAGGEVKATFTAS